MNIQVNSNAFTKLDKMVGISLVDVELLNYDLVDSILKGEIKIYGEYYSTDEKYQDNNGLNNFENIIPFEVVFTKNNVELKSIEVKDFEYYEVAGRGVEATFNIEIEYDEMVDDLIIDDKESLKEEITNQMDQMLSEKLEIKTDNFLEEKIVLPVERTTKKQVDEPKKVYKVIYYHENEDVKLLCNKYHCDYNQILQENQKYSSLGNHRLIISGINECN
ncbi:MAG: hypothetical protein IJ501_01175 [Bacilli bacterium]|nr:hypothetical protein [Bacilli bacterium]MBQ8472094.1 hypothetical protein [Bacilli bacterium]